MLKIELSTHCFSLDLQFLPLLASALEFGSATAPALTAFLKMGAWLSSEDFNKKVIIHCYTFCSLWCLCNWFSYFDSFEFWLFM